MYNNNYYYLLKSYKNLVKTTHKTRPATAKVKSSETSRDLNGYLKPLMHLCTVLNIALHHCIIASNFMQFHFLLLHGSVSVKESHE